MTIKKKCVARHHVGDRVLDITEFGEHPSSRDGRQSFCKSCRNELHKFRRQKDPKFYLTHHIATRVRQQVGAEGYPPGFTRDISKHLGYPILDLVRFLNQDILTREGITLKEAIKRKYHLDHRHPLSKFIVKQVDSPEFRACWAISNLWMLSAEQNLAKSDKVLSGEDLLNMALNKPNPPGELVPGLAQFEAETAPKPANPSSLKPSLVVDFRPKPADLAREAEEAAEFERKLPGINEKVWNKAFG